MKTLKLLSAFALLAMLFTSCVAEVIVEDDPYNGPNPTPTVSLSQVVSSYDLWYVDIDRTVGSSTIPFLQKAFTVSFRNGTLFANNNLVGIGSQGNGFGIDVGFYDTFDFILDISHDIDGFYSFEVTQRSPGEIELYFPQQNVSYILVGYQRNTFDYDRLFYDNIHYFLQEYVTWEKVFTSQEGAINEFDDETYLQFLPGGGDGNFRSSQDINGISYEDIFWDFTGIYNINNVAGNPYLKTLRLNYDYFGDEFFELEVINDGTIEFYHPRSGTVYRFKGRGYIQFKRSESLRESKKIIESQIKKIETSVKI